MAMPSTTHSASPPDELRSSAARLASVSTGGTREIASATSIAACSYSVSSTFRRSAILCSAVPRRSANEQVCAEQYMHEAVQLDVYMASDTGVFGAPTPHRKNGRFRKFGTITL